MRPKLPAMIWYPRDWKNDFAVQSLTFEERGIWWEILQTMQMSESPGKLVIHNQSMTVEDVALTIHCELAKVQQTLSKLLSKGLAKIDEDKTIVNPRMVSDEELRQKRKIAGALGGKQKASKTKAKAKQKSTLSVSSSVLKKEIHKEKNFTKPIPAEVELYAQSIGFNLNGAHFCDYYESKGWKIGSSPMKSWQAAVRTWKSNSNLPQTQPKPVPLTSQQRIEKGKCPECTGTLEQISEYGLICNQCNHIVEKKLNPPEK